MKPRKKTKANNIKYLQQVAFFTGYMEGFYLGMNCLRSNQQKVIDLIIPGVQFRLEEEVFNSLLFEKNIADITYEKFQVKEQILTFCFESERSSKRMVSLFD